MRALFTITIFAGSALLFLVQPLIAKQLLPIFGGSPLVWNTSLLFFQIMLLLGYLYAHLSIKWLGAKKQALVHLALVAVGLSVLPLHVPEILRNAYERALADSPTSILAAPAPVLLAMLLLSVGLPFFALAAGAPTLQRWFAQTADSNAKDPYFLYQASNLASMIALLGYPAWFEREFTLKNQSVYWSAGYVVLLLLLAACVTAIQKQHAGETAPQIAENESLKGTVSSEDRWRWVLLAAFPTTMMAGVTTYITTNVAPIPLLWVLPLALYLITFIIAFSARFNGRTIVYFAASANFLVTMLLMLEKYQPAANIMPCHLLAFFLTVLACHREIGRTRPSPQHLTEFYVWISAGGMLGGFFAAIIAPLAFNTNLEYPIAMVGCFAAIGFAHKKDMGFKWLDLILPGVGVLLIALMQNHFTGPDQYDWVYIALIALGVCALRPVRYAMLLAGLFIYAEVHHHNLSDVIFRQRSFFGTLEVQVQRGRGDPPDGDRLYHVLLNGTTLHGAQVLDGPRRTEPITYYTAQSGLGLAFGQYRNSPSFDHIAVVGLGTGTTAAFGRPGMSIDYYELDPHVEAMARNPRLFSYLIDSKAHIEVKIGDARLRLREAQKGRYGLLALDAFSSDAIPIHLLTREAVQTYLDTLRPDGILAIHISNRFLDLAPIVAAIGTELHLSGLEVTNGESKAERDNLYNLVSEWILLARDPKVLAPIANQSRDAMDLRKVKPVRIWTDDYSNVLGSVRWDVVTR